VFLVLAVFGNASMWMAVFADMGASLLVVVNGLRLLKVLGQREIGPHLRVHLLMLRAAWALRDGRELRGQLLRLALTPIGHLSGRLPLGNTGASNVSPFEPMALPPELERLLRDEER
jgi:hypothetical protein